MDTPKLTLISTTPMTKLPQDYEARREPNSKLLSIEQLAEKIANEAIV